MQNFYEQLSYEDVAQYRDSFMVFISVFLYHFSTLVPVELAVGEKGKETGAGIQ